MMDALQNQTVDSYRPKIMVVTMERSSYLAADALGQLHLEYPTSVYVLKTILPAVLPATFYVDSLKKGIDGILIASAGSDCPVEKAFEVLSATVRKAQVMMKNEGIPAKRLRLVAICSVCTSALLKEINQMTRFCLENLSSARERDIFSSGKDGEEGDIKRIVDGAGRLQTEKGPPEARENFETEPQTLKRLKGEGKL